MSQKNVLRGLFNEAFAGGGSMQRPAPLPTDNHVQRPPIAARAADQTGGATSAYINGLEARLVDHLWRHAPRWHAYETRRVLLRWGAPGMSHPTPSWATPRDMLAEAKEYAAVKVRERLIARMDRLHGIRVARYLDHPRQVPSYREDLVKTVAGIKQHMKQRL